ncbi:class I SAM-dependent methyltransferase [Actinomadura namibiensis]|uniref:class I SAM-dependent methyltransferase n=1 Tax=Actinomadura kijaniata TaxID=46161 RepID=UPI0036158EBC
MPAARAVGATGRVDAVDLADGLVEPGRRRAAAEGLDQVRFHAADVTEWSGPGSYDLVLCGYGIFFLPDRTPRPAGWPGYCGRAAGSPSPPGPKARWRTSARCRTAVRWPSVPAGPGLTAVNVHRIAWQVELTPGNAWSLVVGTGFRAMLHDLDEAAIDRGRDRFLNALTDERIDLLDATSPVVVGSV